MNDRYERSISLARKFWVLRRRVWMRLPLSTVLGFYWAASQIPSDWLLALILVMLIVEARLDGRPLFH